MTSAPTTRHAARPAFPRLIRTFAVPIILAWIVVIAVLNTVVPQLEEVGKLRSISMTPDSAPSMIAMKQIGQTFVEFDSNSSAMIVLEGQTPLGQQAHALYDRIVAQLRADTRHVEYVQDMWSDPLTASGSQSADGKAAYVQVYLRGNQGESLANESVAAARAIIAGANPPPGLKVYVTGPAALMSDQLLAGDESMQLIEAVTFTVIIVMLLLVYRSAVTVVLVLLMVVLELAAARGLIAFLGFHHVFGLSTFATNLLVTLAIAAATDYAIFLIGRYQEARAAGVDREAAFFEMFASTAHVVLGSGLTIAGATFCLHFTRMPYFNSMGIPLAIGMVICVFAALTLGPAVIAVASRFGRTLEPKRALRTRGWRKVGAVVVRWPGFVLVTTVALAIVGLVMLPGYRTSYDDRRYLPADVPANEGYAAADRHFSTARMNPELLMVQSDHDLRNSADFLVIEKIAKAVKNTVGISQVQAITRPEGKPIEHTTIPFQLSTQSLPQRLNEKYQQDRMSDLRDQADDLESTVGTLKKMSSLIGGMAATTHELVGKFENTALDTNELRDYIENFDDFFRPIRAYFYWEPHCYDIPGCWAIRGIFDTLDSVDILSNDLHDLLPQFRRLDSLLPQLVALLPQQIETLESMHTMLLTQYQTQNGQLEQQASQSDDASAMGEAFDASRNDDTFYLPPEIFANEDFKRGMKNFISPDGRSVRFIVMHEGNPLTPEGLSHVEAIKQSAKEAIKGSPLEGSRIYLAGTAATFEDMSDGARDDLVIAGIAALALIFVIMLIITRAVVAAAVIVATVVISLGTSLGLSILVWQHLIGIELHWMVLPMSVIILLAVGADYNLLLVSRFAEEIHAGLDTGIIRAMGGTGSVVTSAGLVFAFTMLSMTVSSLTIIGQVGTTIGIGLLFDTLVVRSLMTPSIAALLGKWFWWPRIVRPRPVPTTFSAAAAAR